MDDNHSIDKRPSRVRIWLTALRAPNLLTVPGDPLAGFLLASWPGVGPSAPSPWPSLLASLCLYCAGLLSNDFFDREEDARERPQRPLPQGWITPGTALYTAMFLTGIGIILAACSSLHSMFTALLLAAVVWAYNAGGKRHVHAGPYLMGLCRALSLLLGATAFGMRGLAVLPILAAGGLFFYIAAVTRIAQNETATVRIGPSRWLPLGVLLLTFVLLFLLDPDQGCLRGMTGWWEVRVYPFLLAGCACGWGLIAGIRLGGCPAPAVTGRVVGSLIRGVLLYQASFCAFAQPSDGLVDLVLLSALPVSCLLSRTFYAS